MKFTKGIKAITMLAVALAFTVTADAQSVGTATTNPNDPTIQQRKENQQDRIGQGVGSGELTARESARLEKKEAALNAETRRMRAANGGKLTRRDKAIVNHQQNKLSRRIYGGKHNGRV